ncbi:MAG: carboxypeptidase-like regulatory domain-containing protein [Longimicrobiales bacterium]
MRSDIVARMLRGIAAGCVLVAPLPLAGQSGSVVDGRIVARDGAGIENAIVRLEGHAPRLSTETGYFRFDDVAHGVRRLRVEAFGHMPATLDVDVQGPATLSLVLESAPFRLDSLVVAPRPVEITGRVRDPERDISLGGAEVIGGTSGGTTTNGAGRFDLDGWEGHPLYVGVRAFGYLPLDTVVVPEREERSFLFPMRADPLVERMIEVEMERLDERAGGRMSITRPPMNRDDLLRYRGASLADLLRARHRTRGLKCVVLDERPLTPEMARAVLHMTMAHEVERIEFLFGKAMLRVYTRDFVRSMLGGGLELGRPVFVSMADPPLCR